MNFSSKTEQTPQELWEELEEMGGRLILTIPFGIEIGKARGFISINGDRETLPIMTICVENSLTERCTVTTMVFDSCDRYLDFVTRLWADSSMSFSDQEFLQ